MSHDPAPAQLSGWPAAAWNFLTALATASLVQASIDLLYWYGGHWYLLGTKRIVTGDVLHPLDNFPASLFGLTAITAAVSLLPALAVMAICRWRDIKGPAAYMTGGALTGIVGVVATTSNPLAWFAMVYAAALALSGIASGYVFWRVGVRGPRDQAKTR